MKLTDFATLLCSKEGKKNQINRADMLEVLHHVGVGLVVMGASEAGDTISRFLAIGEREVIKTKAKSAKAKPKAKKKK